MGQVSVEALGGGVITSGLVIGRPEMGQVLLIFGAYVFAMAFEFGDTELWPLVSSASGRGEAAGPVYSLSGSGHQGESYL